MTAPRRRLVRDRRGVAALELALVAPLLIAMGLGMVETVRYVRIRGCFANAAASMADLVAGQQGVTGGPTGSLHDLCQGAQYEMAPYSVTPLTMSVASYTNPVSGSGLNKDWQYDSPCPGTAAMSSTAAQALATSLTPSPGDSVIIVYATYGYTPWLPNTLVARTFSQYYTARPRFGSVLCPNC